MPSPLSMEQWFLDLDGVRSGPYQTPEILSLIAEGEVMPHHRISTSLKDQNWISILDWRLDQAKKINPYQQAAEVSEQNHFEQRPLDEVEEFIAHAVEQHPPALPPVGPVRHETPPPSTVENKLPSFLTEPDLEPLPESSEVENSKVAPVPPAHELSASHSIPPETTPKKGDPTAEMFDLIQTTKHKREAKSQVIAKQTSIVQEKAGSKSKKSTTKGWSKTLGMGLVIIAAGFALGQLFQQNSGVPEKSATVTTTPSATPAAVVAGSPSKGESEVVDRSTDKMVIRGRDEHKEAQMKDSAKTPTKTPTEKELQELKDLKKELQELKALKDELKNNPGEAPYNPAVPEDANFDTDSGAGNIDPGYNYYPPNGYPSQAPPPANAYPPANNDGRGNRNLNQ